MNPTHLFVRITSRWARASPWAAVAVLALLVVVLVFGPQAVGRWGESLGLREGRLMAKSEFYALLEKSESVMRGQEYTFREQYRSYVLNTNPLSMYEGDVIPLMQEEEVQLFTATGRHETTGNARKTIGLKGKRSIYVREGDVESLFGQEKGIERWSRTYSSEDKPLIWERSISSARFRPELLMEDIISRVLLPRRDLPAMYPSSSIKAIDDSNRWNAPVVHLTFDDTIWGRTNCVAAMQRDTQFDLWVGTEDFILRKFVKSTITRIVPDPIGPVYGACTDHGLSLRPGYSEHIVWDMTISSLYSH